MDAKVPSSFRIAFSVGDCARSHQERADRTELEMQSEDVACQRPESITSVRPCCLLAVKRDSFDSFWAVHCLAPPSFTVGSVRGLAAGATSD